jgi:hypothetical protein
MAERREWQAREDHEEARRIKQTAVLVNRLAVAGFRSDAALGKRLNDIAQRWPAISQTIIKEVSNDPRYRDPACNVSDGVWQALEQAVAATSAGSADGSATVSLPGPEDAR